MIYVKPKAAKKVAPPKKKATAPTKAVRLSPGGGFPGTVMPKLKRSPPTKATPPPSGLRFGLIGGPNPLASVLIGRTGASAGVKKAVPKPKVTAPKVTPPAHTHPRAQHPHPAGGGPGPSGGSAPAGPKPKVTPPGAGKPSAPDAPPSSGVSPPSTPPVGGGTGSTGGTSGAAGSAVAGAGDSMPSSGNKTVDKLFGPLMAEITSQKKRTADQKAKGEANIKAFQDWMSGMLTTSTNAYTNNMTAAQQSTSANLASAAQAVAGLNRGTDAPGMDAISGIGAAEAANNTRATINAGDTSMTQNVQAAIAARLKENPGIIGGVTGQVRSDLQGRISKAEQSNSQSAAQLLFEMGKAKLQSEADARTASALGLQNQFDNELAVQKLEQEDAKTKQSAALTSSQIALNKARTRQASITKTKGKGSGKAYKDFFDVVLAARKRAAGGQYDSGKLTTEDKNAVIAAASAHAQRVALGWQLDPAYVTWALYDVFGEPSVTRALNAAKAAKKAATTMGPVLPPAQP